MRFYIERFPVDKSNCLEETLIVNNKNIIFQIVKYR